MLPPAYVPTPSGTWKSAATAAEPADEPPGVRFRSWEFVVFGPEFVTVNSVVVDLPKMSVPALGKMETAEDSKSGRFP